MLVSPNAQQQALDFLDFADGERPSYSSFVRVYHSDWQHCLKIRHEGQHSKCSDCEKFKRLLRLSSKGSDIHRSVMTDYTAHIQDMLSDRKLDAKLRARARAHPEKLLNLSIDSMDVAKWKCPRNLAAAKDFQSLWRPECTFTVVLIEGINECFYVMDMDIIKDSNLMITLLSRAIHTAFQHYDAKGWQRPSALRIHSDNAAGETKNQHVFRWCSALLYKGVFSEISVTQFRVGHSHGEPDERFAAVRTLLADSVELQDPKDFIARVKQVKPRAGRTVSVEHLQVAFDFKAQLEALDKAPLHGHVQTKQQKEANLEAVHVFSLKPRSEWQQWADEPDIKELQGFSRSDQDIVMEVWHHLASPEVSQDAFVYMPAELLSTVSLENLRAAARRRFSDKQVKEFRKTANEVLKSPWRLYRANHFLHCLVNCNENPHLADWQVPDITLIYTSGPTSGRHHDEEKVTETDLLFSRRSPAPVSVGPAKPRATAAKSKPAAASASRADDMDLEGELPEAPGVNNPDEMDTEVDIELPADDDVAMPPPLAATAASGTQGCPEMMRGRDGAPERVAVAKTTPKPKGKAAAKAKTTSSKSPAAKTKTKADESQAKKPKYGLLPFPDDVHGLGCPKCVHNKRIGCARCRAKQGLVLNEDKTAWIWKDPQ